MLLVRASRRRGERIPGTVLPPIGTKGTVLLVVLASLALMAWYALLVWESPLPRLLVGSAAIVATTMVVDSLRHGAFDRRAVVELRVDRGTGGQAAFQITAGGERVPVDVLLAYTGREEAIHASFGDVPGFARLRTLTVTFPANLVKDAKVWVHEVTPEQVSLALPAQIRVEQNGHFLLFDQVDPHGQVAVRLGNEPCEIRIGLAGDRGTVGTRQ
jgi:hypothetical protein